MLTHDILEELILDLKALDVSNVPDNVQRIIILAAVSSYWLPYANKLKNTNNYLSKKLEGFLLNILIKDISSSFLKDINKLLKIFPKNHISKSYNNPKVLDNVDCNLFALFDLCELETINKELRQYEILGSFSEKFIRKSPFASLIFTNETIIDHEFDLSFTTTLFDEKRPSKKNKINLLLNETPTENTDVINRWNSFFENIVNQKPCFIMCSEELENFLRKEDSNNIDIFNTTLKFIYSYILLQRSSLKPKADNNEFTIFEASQKDFDTVFNFIRNTTASLNQLPKISIEILNLIAKKYNDNSSFTRKHLLKDTGWSPAKLSAALRPLERYEILPYKKERRSHQKIYKYCDMFSTGINSKQGGFVL